MKYYIGTSGWSYYSFKGIFYPQDTKPREWLKIYAQHFNTVEINVTFYKVPTKKTFEKWYNETPEDFVFSLKIPKTITHIKKLKEIEEDLKSFLKSIEPLKEKGKVLLFQLPPSLRFDKELFERFVKTLPTSYKNVIEIRNKTFHTEEFVRILESHNVCLCLSDCAGRYPSWYEIKTANFLYLRMHGSRELYVSKYEEAELQNLAQKIKNFADVEEVYIYFDNTALGHAVTDAKALRELLLF